MPKYIFVSSAIRDKIMSGIYTVKDILVAEQVGYLNIGKAFKLSTSVHRYDHYYVQMILTRN